MQIPWITELQWAPPEDRKIIIQWLWKKPWEVNTDALWEQYRDQAWNVLEYASIDPTVWPIIRYELEDYTNDLNPWLPQGFIEEYKWKTARVLDLGTWPGDVMLRMYETLLESWIRPLIICLELSKGFVRNINAKARELWLTEQDIDVQNFDLTQLWNLDVSDIDLVTANYVLDRIPQRRFLKDIKNLRPRFMQLTNCVPLQYRNPETWKLYIPESEIIIPEGASDLSSVWDALSLKDPQFFSGTNTVSSLQDREEEFKYAGIRWKMNS